MIDLEDVEISAKQLLVLAKEAHKNKDYSAEDILNSGANYLFKYVEQLKRLNGPVDD